MFSAAVAVVKGSSPHTRGAPHFSFPFSSGSRIIPAYAGSTSVSIVRSYTVVGSSPHTRGALDFGDPRVVGVRIIPAYAGSTPWSSRSGRGPPDHPRIRGEHVPGLVSLWWGSRIIPAYAGSTAAPESGEPFVPDHPRIRGEHRSSTTTTRRRGGSSPHTRGAPGLGPAPGFPVGIIPAYAGSTCCTYSLPRLWQDHPRIRGEHPLSDTKERTSHGSSPHTRGAPCTGCRTRD